MIKLFAIAALATAGTTGLLPSVEQQDSKLKRVEVTEWLRVDCVARSQQDLAGSLIHIAGTEVQLRELVYGANEQNELVIAYFRGNTIDGRDVFVDRRDQVSTLFADPARIYCVYPESFGLDAGGVASHLLPSRDPMSAHLGFASANGPDAPMPEILFVPTPLCVSATPDAQCRSVDCSPSSTCKDPYIDPQSGEIVCDCTNSMLECNVNFVYNCPTPALCPVGKDCKNKLLDPTQCECR